MLTCIGCFGSKKTRNKTFLCLPLVGKKHTTHQMLCDLTSLIDQAVESGALDGTKINYTHAHQPHTQGTVSQWQLRRFRLNSVSSLVLK